MREPAQLREALERTGAVHIDAPVLGFHLLGAAAWTPLTRVVLDGLAAGGFRATTSSITLFQLLAEPLRRGLDQLARETEAAVAGIPGLEVVPLTDTLARDAARVRARLGGGVERAVQIATALDAGAELFVTGPSSLRRVATLRVVGLEPDAGEKTGAGARPGA